MNLSSSLGHLRGATVCDGKWRLLEPLFGSVDESVWRAEPNALVTVGWSTGLSDSELSARLALPFPGVTPLLAVGTIDGTDREVVVEVRPRGAPSPMPAPDVATACRWGARVAEIVAEVHRAGAAVGGLRPEAVWIDDGEVTAIVPRATRFWEMQTVDVGIVPGFSTVLLSPERLAGAGPSAADDVFALAATVAIWASGRHPFAGDTRDAQVLALLGRRRAPFAGPPRLAALLDAALGDASARPSIAAFGAALTEIARSFDERLGREKG